jgi:hypothetical protein
MEQMTSSVASAFQTRMETDSSPNGNTEGTTLGADTPTLCKRGTP